MHQDHEIVAQVYAAKVDRQAADRLINQYMPFIKSETSKFIKRNPIEGQDDELAIAMFAFHDAIKAYCKDKGAFLPFAAITIRNRLIDHNRKEKRHANIISLDQKPEEDKNNPSLLEQLDTGRDEISERVDRSAMQDEIFKFSKELSAYGLTLTKIAENCPKQDRTLAACHQTLAYAKKHPELLDVLTKTKKLPLKQLATGAGVERKMLERHRKYMLAILLAYTNGFELIRGHLGQVAR